MLKAFVVLLTAVNFSVFPEISYAAESEFSLESSEIRAQLTPVQSAQISATMSGLVTFLEVREGEAVKKGQTLVRFDCSTERARLQKANTDLKIAQNKMKGHERMAELDAIGDIELENSRLEVAKAKAEVSVLQTVVDKCRIKAPFNGFVGEKLIQSQEFIELGKPIIELQDNEQLIVEFIAPSKWVSWLTPGYAFSVFLSDTNQSYPAKLIYTASQIDALSQSIKVYAKIDGEFPELLPGMSGFIEIQSPKSQSR